MCCIIYRLKNTAEIKEDNLLKIIKKNRDGWGISFINDDGILVIEKKMGMELAIPLIRKLEKENKEFLFHARWATHGLKDEFNCHPYPIIDGVMFHNGKMENLKMWNKDKSDTWHFTFFLNKFIKKGLTIEHLLNKKYKNIIDDSRFAFMFNDGRIIKHGVWHEIDGNLYSKLDWQLLNNNQNNWRNWTVDDTKRYKEYRNKYSQSSTPYIDKAIKEYNNKPKRIISMEELNDIEIAVSQGEVKDEFIELLDVDDITILVESYPETMGNYMFEMLNRI